MKHNWEYKRLGEICKIYQPQTISTKELVNNGAYNVFGANGIIGKYDKYNHVNAEILMTCRGATCGTINVSTPFSWVNGNAMVIHCEDENVSFSYLRECLKTLDYSSIITGAAQPQITRQSLSPVSIPVPPMAVQEQIVAELDAINGLIEKNREVLRHLDALAQSLFYDTFGDPITNPKGWEMKTWDDCLKIINGKNQKTVENPNGKYPIYGSGGIMSYADSYLCPEFCTIIGRKGNISKPIFVKTKFWNVDTAFGLCADKNIIAPFYLFFFCKNYDFERHNKAVTIPSLVKGDLLKIKIPVPPLALQESFAEKIEAIEGQKGKVEAVTARLQTLLDSRMDYWFN